MEQNWELLRQRKNYVRMIDEVGEVKMEATVRTLNSAKLKWKLSRNDFVSRSRAPRELKWNTFRNLSCEAGANKFPLENRGPEYHYFTVAPLSIVAARLGHFLAPFLAASRASPQMISRPVSFQLITFTPGQSECSHARGLKGMLDHNAVSYLHCFLICIHWAKKIFKK